MIRYASLAIVLCLLFSGFCAAATGQYIIVEVESFESWGILHWGSWQEMDEELIAKQIRSLSSQAEEDLEELLIACDGTEGTPASSACNALERFNAVHESEYTLAPMLGRAYRLKLRNLTGANLGVVVAVDGLNSNGNAPIIGDSSDKKWILKPHQSVYISGWQVDEDRALQFEFSTPSQSHVADASARGQIDVHVYLSDPFADEGRKGTEAGPMIDQPTVLIPFASATPFPVETLVFDYSREGIALGIQCLDTDGAGVEVVGVVEGTAAANAGLRAGDIITYANAVPINTCQDFADLLATKSPGDRLVLKVHRTDRVYLMTIELEE